MQILVQSPSYHLTKPCCPLGSLTTQPVLSYQRIWAERHLHRETVCTTSHTEAAFSQGKLYTSAALVLRASPRLSLKIRVVTAVPEHRTGTMQWVPSQQYRRNGGAFSLCPGNLSQLYKKWRKRL